jgi:short-subunit dehydrogenase
MTRYDAPRVILITGATGGIGTALAREYAGSGRTLILLGRDADRLGQVAVDCKRAGAETLSLALDVSDTAALMARLREISDERAIDLAILNAGVTSGISRRGEAESWTEIDRVLEINVRAALATVTALLPAMRRRGFGQIALISSLSAYWGLPLTPAYSASKAALKAYGEALRGPLAAEGVAVNVVLPGFVRTPMGERFPGPRPFLLSPEDAAHRIRTGLGRNRPRIAFPAPLSWGMWALSVLPAGWPGRILQFFGYGPRG